MSHELAVAPATEPSAADAAVERAALRRVAFLYQDGVMLNTTVRALDALGQFDPDGPRDLPDTGYLRAAWRCLESAGWLDHGPSLDWTDAGRAAMRHRERYVAGGRFLARFASNAPDSWAQPWDPATEVAFAAEVDAHERWRATADPDDLVTVHLDSALVLPALLTLWATGGLEHPDGDIGRLLTLLGWLDADGRWTPQGRGRLTFLEHFGLIGSYLPMLANLEQLLRGELRVTPGEDEWHVQRQINVESSAAAHQRYFADADPVFREIFSREPRPTFIADMGCGDGSWLVHLHEYLGDDIRYIGIDASPVALDTARAALLAAGIADPLLLLGDISDPAALARSLAEHGVAIEDGLHIRSFLDHDRTYVGGVVRDDVPGWSTGAYAAPDGSPLSAVEVESDLVEHFRRWTPHVGKHGLVILEVHCVAPQIARRHLGALHSVAFDSYHGMSHQYPMEYSAFMRCCQLAGLQATSYLERRYPSNKPFVAVSLNRLMPPRPAPRHPVGDRRDTWQPTPGTDLSDGIDLHRLLYTDGDLAYPRSWASAATGFVVRDMLAAIEARVEGARRGDVVRVIDYGAGTGLASLELSKACADHNVVDRLADRGATFEMHVVDIPSGWFAQGFELLREVPWTRFHALRIGEGSFRPLIDVTGGEQVDAVMANMVFHLLHPSAMRSAAASIAGVLRPGGQLSFNSPDLGPTGRHSELFHGPNRLMRRYWLEALDAPDPSTLAPVLRAAVATVRPEARSTGQLRADRRILPTPQTVTSVADALAPYFHGGVDRRAYEMLAEEILMTALVPANQAEYLSEIADRPLREDVISHLMTGRVLPELMAGPAGTALGLNMEWTLGRYLLS
ncbi:class I SAM-dependent methyltransferase [Longispora sp. K20-0274]|uniref:AprA-related methyltransferase n=1 Tax=Longispora sp. K20-0274 TaxID=3088255 RepID=UPI00399AF992